MSVLGSKFVSGLLYMAAGITLASGGITIGRWEFWIMMSIMACVQLNTYLRRDGGP